MSAGFGTDHSGAVQNAAGLLLGWLGSDPSLSRGELIERLRVAEPLLDGVSTGEAVDRALERAHGFGAIAELLRTEGVTEVMINGPGPVWVDQDGTLAATDINLAREEIDVMIERMLDPLGLRVDRSSPIADARLADGSRVNVVVPPLAVDGPVVTIRRFSARPVPLEAFGPPECVAALEQIVRERRTVLVVGGTGAGKTTLLNALGAHLHRNERVVVVEDTSELRFPGDHVVRLEARPANSEGIGEVTIRQLVKTALRMRPDRLVIGEVRGAEALDLVMALNTGHDGSLATCHANGVGAGLRRLETLALLGDVGLPLVAVREQIASAVDVVVHVGRSTSGERRVTEIALVADAVVGFSGGLEFELSVLWRAPEVAS